MDAVRALLSLGVLAALGQAAVLSFLAHNAPLQLVGKFLNDSRYDKWLQPQRILYRFDHNSYSTHEKDLILLAMSRIGEDVGQCVTFQEYDAVKDAGLDNIYISKTLNDGSIPATCFTFYGRLLRAAGQGQKMAIHDGPNGCMDSVRDVMKVLVNVLGLRNEYNRPDRDSHMKVFHESLQKELRNSNLLSIYNESQVDFERLPFDYNSITFPSAIQWATEGSVWFEFPAGHELPKLDHLSKSDCIGLSWMYGCDESKCLDHYNVLPAALQDKVEIKQFQTTSTAAASKDTSTIAAITHEATTEAATSASTVHVEESTKAELVQAAVAHVQLDTTVELSTQAHVEETTSAPSSHQAETSTLAVSHAVVVETSTQAADTSSHAVSTQAHMEETTSAAVSLAVEVHAKTTQAVVTETSAAATQGHGEQTTSAAAILAAETHTETTQAVVVEASTSATHAAETSSLATTQAAVADSSSLATTVHVEESTHTAHIEETTTQAVLNLTLIDVIFPRDHVSSEAVTQAPLLESSTLKHEELAANQEPGLKMIVIAPQVKNSQLSFAAVEVQSANVSESTTTQTATTVQTLEIAPADSINLALNPKIDAEVIAA